MADTPQLFVCHGDEGGVRLHPCRRVQEALRERGIEYEKVIAAHGSPLPFLRKGSRESLKEATGDTRLPALKLPDGRVITHSRAILAWIKEHPGTSAEPELPGSTAPPSSGSAMPDDIPRSV